MVPMDRVGPGSSGIIARYGVGVHRLFVVGVDRQKRIGPILVAC